MKQLISDIGSERATNDSGKIITFGGFTHVAWQDVTREGYFNRVRSCDHRAGSWTDPVTLDKGIDNYARGVLTIDPEGHLHVILGGHATAVTHRRSVRPHDSSEWTAPQPVGVGTYPIFLCAPDGSLYLSLRGQGAERADRGVDLYRCPPGGEWGPALRVVQLAEEYGEAYAGFHMQMAFGPGGLLHAIIDFYEGEDEHGRGLHQATCYACSRDGGDSWQRADGTPVTVPARPEDLDILARNTRSRHEPSPPAEIRQGGLVVDSHGQPYFFYLHHTEAPGRLMMGTVIDGSIETKVVSGPCESQWPDMRAVGCWSTIREDDRIFALVQLSPYNDEWKDGLPTRAMGLRERHDERLAWLITADGGKTFEAESFLEPGSAYNCPSLEKPVGANRIPADRRPGVIYFDGSNEYPGGGDYYDESQTVAEILASGGFRCNNVWLT